MVDELGCFIDRCLGSDLFMARLEVAIFLVVLIGFSVNAYLVHGQSVACSRYLEECGSSFVLGEVPGDFVVNESGALLVPNSTNLSDCFEGGDECGAWREVF